MDCNKKFGLSLSDTLKIAQKLYEDGYTTYPRTDSMYLPNDMVLGDGRSIIPVSVYRCLQKICT
ncbi:MAG: DNA topoisomerase [Lachnospiraceae bacterium]